MIDDQPVSMTPKYLIGTVTKRTGLSADVVRVWERRYGAVRPARSSGGTRLYSDADILRLTRLSQAVQRGHSISQAAMLSEDELDEMIIDSQQSGDGANPYLAARERFIEAVQILDTAAADRELALAATLFPTREMVKYIIEPILHDLGNRELSAASEHVASWLLRNMVSSLFRLYPPSENADTLVVAAPSAEGNDFWLLLAALLAATHGWRAVYLGANLPAAEIANAVRLTNARILLLRLAIDHRSINEKLLAISNSILVPATTRVWVIGSEAQAHRELILRAEWTVVRDLEELDVRLGTK